MPWGITDAIGNALNEGVNHVNKRDEEIKSIALVAKIATVVFAVLALVTLCSLLTSHSVGVIILGLAFTSLFAVLALDAFNVNESAQKLRTGDANSIFNFGRSIVSGNLITESDYNFLFKNTLIVKHCYRPSK